MILGENISKVYNYGKNIQKVYSYGKLVWEKQSSEDIDYSTTPFTITAVADDVSVKFNARRGEIDSTTVLYGVDIKYKINNGDWKTGNSLYYINLKKNDVLYISAILPSNLRYNEMTINGLADISGNIMSLIFADDFIGRTEAYMFDGFFGGCDIRNAKNLILPATTLISGCYKGMFAHCENLITAPELPATTLASSCYDWMFERCEKLIQAPSILPATTLEWGCYRGMFEYCYELTQAPELPATNLAEECYSHMFYACNLITAPELPATKLANYCYDGMFYGCEITQAPELPATTLAEGCYRDMFRYCRNLIQAPELPATTLKSKCYQTMFRDCSNLNYIKANFTTTPKISYTEEWVRGVSPTGTFVKNKNATWDVSGINGIPSGWTVEYI